MPVRRLAIIQCQHFGATGTTQAPGQRAVRARRTEEVGAAMEIQHHTPGNQVAPGHQPLARHTAGIRRCHMHIRMHRQRQRHRVETQLGKLHHPPIDRHARDRRLDERPQQAIRHAPLPAGGRPEFLSTHALPRSTSSPVAMMDSASQAVHRRTGQFTELDCHPPDKPESLNLRRATRMTEPAAPESLRLRLRHIIFGTNTTAGRLFDQLLIVTITASVIAVMLDSVQDIHEQYGNLLYALEWGFTLVFTVEYLVRLWISDRPGRYAFSFYGVVDLLSVLPTYISLVAPGANYLLTIRILRVLRIFRVMRLLSFMSEANFLIRALTRARRKIAVFLFTVL